MILSSSRAGKQLIMLTFVSRSVLIESRMEGMCLAYLLMLTGSNNTSDI